MAPQKVSIRVDVVQAIRDLTLEFGFPPTVREICARLGKTSIGSVHSVLQQMREDGLIEWNGSRQRTIRVISSGPSRSDVRCWSDEDLERVFQFIRDEFSDRELLAPTF